MLENSKEIKDLSSEKFFSKHIKPPSQLYIRDLNNASFQSKKF